MNASGAPTAPIEVRVEGRTGDALGIGIGSPRLSWVYSPASEPTPNVTAQLRIRRNANGSWHEHLIEVAADASVLLPWPLAPLQSRERAEVSLRLNTDHDGAPGPWSAPVIVEAGLLWPGDLRAAMVGPAWPEPLSDRRHPPLVRTEFELPAVPCRARLYLSGYGLVAAQLNGAEVGGEALTPGWTDYRNRLHYATYDVTSLLQRGENAVGFWLGDGWYRGRIGFEGGTPNFYGDRLGIWAQLEVECADGTSQIVASNAWDGRWLAAPSPITMAGLYEGEHFDARLEQTGWTEPGHTGEDWQPVTEIPFDALSLAARDAEPVRATGTNPVRQITKTGKNTFLLDFGQNCTQRLRLNTSALPADREVTIRHAEVLEPDGTLSMRPLRRAVQTDRFISAGTTATWEPRFTMHGFRYAEITGWPGALEPADVTATAYGSDLRRTGWFDCSDPILNRLHENIVWSTRSNMVSIPTDCPQRDERCGWTGDIALFAPTAMFLYDASSMLSSWLVDLEYETRRCGTVPYYVPFLPLAEWRKPAAIAIWGDAAVLVPWAIYQASGDVERLAAQYPCARLWIDEVAGYLSPDGVWDRRPDLFAGQLGDWLDPTAPPQDPAKAMTEKELVATAFFANSCRITSRVAEILDDDERARQYGALADRVRDGFVARFIRSDGMMTSDTQTAYALAISFGLLEGDPRLSAAGDRLASLVQQRGYTVGTGFAGTPYVLPALSATGHLADAYRLIESRDCPSWGYQVAMGATTTWERWDSMLPDGSVNPGGMTSFNHYAFGSVADWMHQTIGGVRQLEAGWRTFDVAPAPGGGLDRAHVAFDGPRGLIDVDWRLAAGQLDLALQVPANSTAQVRLPGLDIARFGAGRHALQAQIG